MLILYAGEGVFYMKRKVVITGMGLLSPIGNSVDAFWKSLLAGRGGVGPITYFDTEPFDVKIAAELKDFDPYEFIDKKEARRLDPFARYALIASQFAVEDAGIDFTKVDLDRCGVITGSGIGGMDTFEREYKSLFEKGPRRVSPLFIPMMIPDIAPGHISIKYGCRGHNYSTTSACASSSHAIGNAMSVIQSGIADVMITGGSEAAITRMGVAGFSNMKALSTRNDDPATASRPFDAGRDGFVVGEGAGILILESEEHAQRRNARIHAELIGSGYSGDAYHITAPAPGGYGAVRAMQTAIADAGLDAKDVDYINAHGTSTPHNDKTETEAIKTVFGERAKDIPISSTKSMIGHLLGASGAVEMIATVKILQEGVIHPTVNQIESDPECDLNYTPNEPVEKEVNIAISNSFGFGGHNVCLAVKRYV